jgi:hypothetical protein
MSYEESVSYFKRLENLEKIRSINGTATVPLDNEKSITSSEDKSSKLLRILSLPTCGVSIVIRTTTIRLITE